MIKRIRGIVTVVLDDGSSVQVNSLRDWEEVLRLQSDNIEAIKINDPDSQVGQIFEALKINRGSFGKFLENWERWDDDDIFRIYYHVVEENLPFSLDTDVSSLDMCFSKGQTVQEYLEELAYNGNLPRETLLYYVDFGAMAKDHAYEYREIETAEGSYIVERE